MTMTAENEFRHHWPAVMACFWVAVFSWGFCFYGQAVYLAALREATGWSTSLISGATTLCYLTGAGFMAFVPQWIARLGPRRVLGGGVIVLGLGTIGLGHATTPWHLFTASLVMALGWSCTSVAAIPVSLSPWFDRRRALAISLALNGASVGGFTVAPLMVHLLEDRALGIAVTEAVMAGWLVVLPWIAWGLGPAPAAARLPPPPRGGDRANQPVAPAP